MDGQFRVSARSVSLCSIAQRLQSALLWRLGGHGRRRIPRAVVAAQAVLLIASIVVPSGAFAADLSPQTIAFASLPDTTYGTPPIALSATASSSLQVTFAAEGPCSVVGNSLSLTGTGTCTVIASQTGDATWAAA